MTVACTAKKYMDSRGKIKGESWKAIGSRWRAVKRRQLRGQWETAQEREVSPKGGGWGGEEARNVSVVKA